MTTLSDRRNSEDEYARRMEKDMQQHEAYDNPNYKWSAEDFELGAPLGRGKYGRVYCARERKTNFLVALKVLYKSQIQKDHVERLIVREIEIQSRLRHPNIVPMYAHFHNDKAIFLVLELAEGGELYRHLQMSPNSRFPEDRAARYTYQVADALNYCHLNNVIHRDLKPENLMLCANDTVKLADFGWSVHTTSNARTTMCGTLDYLPPEMVEYKTYDNSVDQWCLGVLCFEFLVGTPPFESAHQHATYEKIRKLAIKFPSHVSIGAKDLITGLLRKRTRSTLVEVMQHPWIQGYKDCDMESFVDDTTTT